MRFTGPGWRVTLLVGLLAGYSGDEHAGCIFNGRDKRWMTRHGAWSYGTQSMIDRYPYGLRSYLALCWRMCVVCSVNSCFLCMLGQAKKKDPRERNSSLVLIHHLVLELRRERLVSDENLLAVLNQIAQLLLEVGAGLLLEARHLHVQRLFASADR